MHEGYWDRLVQTRLSRRRTLAAVGATSAAAALLAACGSDSGGSGGSGGGEGGGGTSGLLTEPVDTFKQAVRGGVYLERATGDPATLDPDRALNPLNPPARLAYNTLVRLKPGHLEPNDNSLMPDIAESWEVSGDGTQITLKLRQGVKWHNKPPVSGRTMDIEDVMFAYNRFAGRAPARVGIVNSVNPDAPVLSFSATDSKTIVIKLKEPVVYALDLFASNTASHSGSILMLPKETDSTFNVGTDMIGAGPYYMDSYQVSQGFVMKRHNEYYDKDWGLLDEIQFPIITEAAAALAQFKAGNLLQYAVSANDILAVKREEPRLAMYQTEQATVGSAFTFGLLPEGQSPFLDERVRQAVSMSWDRDLFIDAVRNVDTFRREGLPVETRWNSALGSTWDGWWLDPKGKDFGPNAKYYVHNIAEAKKLLAAAGYPDGIKGIKSNHITTNQLGTLPQNAEILDGMMSEAGLISEVNAFDYTTEYIPKYRDGHGQYEGWAYHTNAGGTGIGPVGLLANEYWAKGGGAFKGFSASGKNDQSGDPQLNTMIEKARLEQDVEKRRSLVYDIQRHIAGKMWGMIFPGGSNGFALAWPALGNYRVWNGPQVWAHYQLWIDKTKAPYA